ncbi:MAG: hypothetical protein ACRDIB_18410 [Ardenticatenaceae bacterium]
MTWTRGIAATLIGLCALMGLFLVGTIAGDAIVAGSGISPATGVAAAAPVEPVVASQVSWSGSAEWYPEVSSSYTIYVVDLRYVDAAQPDAHPAAELPARGASCRA